MGVGKFALIMIGSYLLMCIPIIIHEKCKSPERKQEEQERFAKNRAKLAQQWEQDRMSRKIVEVTLLGVSGIQHKRGGLGGALFGGFIGGVPGAVVGAVLRSGKCVPVQRFAVKYGNGEIVIRECMEGSSEYKALMKYVVK